MLMPVSEYFLVNYHLKHTMIEIYQTKGNGMYFARPEIYFCNRPLAHVSKIICSRCRVAVATSPTSNLGYEFVLT